MRHIPADRSKLIECFCLVHEQRVSLEKIDGQTTPVTEDTPGVISAAQAVSRVFRRWGQEALAEWKKQQVAKSVIVKATQKDVTLFLDSWWGPTAAQRAEELARERVLAAIEGYKSGQTTAAEWLELKAGGFPELTQNITNTLLEGSLEFSQATVERITEYMRDELLAGVVRGDGVTELGDRIGTVFEDLESYEALRIARTEYAGAQSDGAAQTYLDNGLQYAQMVAAPDCCDICRGYNDRIYKLEDILAHFPFHPNDRCAWTVLENDEVDPADVEEKPPYNVFDDEFAGAIQPLGK